MAEKIEFQDVCCAGQHSFVISDGKVFAFGKDYAGELGLSFKNKKEDFFKHPSIISHFLVKYMEGLMKDEGRREERKSGRLGEREVEGGGMKDKRKRRIQVERREKEC